MCNNVFHTIQAIDSINSNEEWLEKIIPTIESINQAKSKYAHKLQYMTEFLLEYYSQYFRDKGINWGIVAGHLLRKYNYKQRAMELVAKAAIGKLKKNHSVVLQCKAPTIEKFIAEITF